jgi:hypothetical protein
LKVENSLYITFGALHGCSDRFWEPFVAKIGGDYLSDIKKCNVLGPLKKTLKHAFM